MRFIEDVGRDAGFATRTLLRTPSFLVAALSLGLAIGATTAVYSTADWLLHKPMGGVTEPQRLVTLLLYEKDKPDLGPFGFSFDQVHQFGAVQDGFSSWAAYGKISHILADDRGADELVFEQVTGGFFATLGARAAVGRLIGPEDDRPGQPLVAVISHALWRSRFEVDPGVLGKTVRINGHDAVIVGVLSKDFEDADIDWNGPADLWLPMDRAQENGLGVSTTGTFYPIVGRIDAGLSVELISTRAQAWLRGIAPIKNGYIVVDAVKVIPTNETRIGTRDKAGSFLDSLLVVCLLILLAACVNLANVFLGRAVTRRRELALRSSLGASRRRIWQQLITESILVGACASLVGVAVGVGIARLMAPLPRIYLDVTAQIAPITTTAAIGSTLIRAAVALGFATSILFGLVPVILAARHAPMSILRQATPSWTWAGFRLSLRQVAMALQVALSVTLAIIAGLYARSFARVAAVDAGYPHPDSLLIARLVLPIPREDRASFYREFLARVGARPEVVAASMGAATPFVAGVSGIRSPEGTVVQSGLHAAAPRFFAAEGVQLVAGREFMDPEADSNVVVVNRELAEGLWPGGDAVGRILIYYGEVEKRVIGVVSDGHCQSPIGDGFPCVWKPYPMTSSGGYARIRTRRDGIAFAPVLRDIVREINPDVAVTQVTTLDAIESRATGTQRLAATISSGLGLFCIALLAVGAVTLFLSMVRDSLREIAIRMALGAQNARIMGRVMAQGLVLTLVGVLLGLVGARLVSPYVAAQLYRTDAGDPLTFTIVPLFVTLVGTAAVAYASFVAVRTDPVEHLHVD